MQWKALCKLFYAQQKISANHCCTNKGVWYISVYSILKQSVQSIKHVLQIQMTVHDRHKWSLDRTGTASLRREAIPCMGRLIIHVQYGVCFACWFIASATSRTDASSIARGQPRRVWGQSLCNALFTPMMAFAGRLSTVSLFVLTSNTHTMCTHERRGEGRFYDVRAHVVPDGTSRYVHTR